jgi:hypothetical protein
MGVGDYTSAARRRFSRADPADTVGPPPAPLDGSPSPDELAERLAREDLKRRRDELALQVAELHWDLGGLAYEMAIRDHFRLDVLVSRAAVLQQSDAELAETDRLLRMHDTASAGGCPTCGAPHSRGAGFCWRCGTELIEGVTPSAAPATMDAVDVGL